MGGSSPRRRGIWRQMNEYGPAYPWLYPELERLEDEQDLRDAIYDAHMAVIRSRSFWVFFLVALVFGMLVGLLQGLFADAFLARLGLPWWVGLLFIFTLATSIGGACFMIVYFRPMQRFFRTRLNELKLPTCLNCGYDLQSAPSERCPECGQLPATAAGE